MKGYRTIIFSLAMTMIGLLGFKVSPDTANHWMDVFVAIWGIGAILLRQFTTTPVGNIALVPSPGLSPSDAAGLRQDLQTLLGHSTASLQAAALTANMSQKFELVLSALQAIAATAAPASPPAPVAAPAAQAAVPAMVEEADTALVPTEPAPAQPSPPMPDASPAAPGVTTIIPAGVAFAGGAVTAADLTPHIIAAV